MLPAGVLVLIIAFISIADGSAPSKSKRQIYREQVLPSKGGKIPDGAFTSDRLALNKLNKAGISIPDGVLLEQRHVHSHPHKNQHDPEDEESLIQIVQRPEDRYVPSPGKYDNQRPLTVASTYIIRKPVGSLSSGIRFPVDQATYPETLSQNQGNQIYQFYPDYYYRPPQQYVPQKYLPAELTAPPHKYLSVEAAPELPVEIQAPPAKYLPVPPKYADLGTPSTNIVHHPSTYGYSAPVSYQQVHQSVAYYPIPVPLEIPNKDSLKGGYYTVKSQGNSYGGRDTENVHNVISWPYLLKQYTQLSDKINVLNHDSYTQPTPHSLFFTPEVLGSIDPGSSYYATRDRYARKSKEIAFTDSLPDPNLKTQVKDTRRLIKLKCKRRLENTVEDGSTQCFIRY